MTRPLSVAISGFGVAGAFAATLLARRGHSVQVFERSPTLSPVGAGLLLQPSGQGALRRADLLDAVLSRSHPIDELLALKSNGKTLTHLRYVDLEGGGRAYGVRRTVLFDALHGAATRAGATVHLGREMTGQCESQSGICLMDTKGDVHGPFDLALGCDGARSPLRAASPVHCSFTAYSHGAAYANAPAPKELGTTLLQITRGTGQLIGLLPTAGGRCSLFVGLPVRDFERVKAAGFAAFRDAVLALAPQAAECFNELNAFAQFVLTPYYRVTMPRWHAGRLCFLGDAAHAMSPHLGQGVNLALLDVEALVDALTDGSAIPAALAHYDQSRRRHTAFYARLSHLLTPFFQSDGRIRARGRDACLPWFPKVPCMRRRMLHTLTGARQGWLG